MQAVHVIRRLAASGKYLVWSHARATLRQRDISDAELE